MRQSFYQYLMTLRNPNDHGEIANFAQNAFLDHSFPKQATSYDELDRYLEAYGGYLPNRSVFDDAYNLYLDNVGGHAHD
ncbi:YozE family protein [Lacticaseibacillus brantae]|nr:YozE family protein [Lacticaseibacillus brantae]